MDGIENAPRWEHPIHCVAAKAIDQIGLGMGTDQPKNPLHGLTLEKIVVGLVDHYGWEELAGKIDINCFRNDPSVKSSLKFLRKTPWARQQVERLYIATFTSKKP